MPLWLFGLRLNALMCCCLLTVLADVVCFGCLVHLVGKSSFAEDELEGNYNAALYFIEGQTCSEPFLLFFSCSSRLGEFCVTFSRKLLPYPFRSSWGGAQGPPQTFFMLLSSHLQHCMVFICLSGSLPVFLVAQW